MVSKCARQKVCHNKWEQKKMHIHLSRFQLPVAAPPLCAPVCLHLPLNPSKPENDYHLFIPPYITFTPGAAAFIIDPV